ncbi:hypothetical protein SAMN05444285_1345 [Draconibacterium orientale]|uniref:Uncharacterized protein n=1 Tax=Draconibacterium orientale TaxID=1168034 RepID=A0A1I0IR89_9BACT|nr:hypothetical protein SAMN05444285_1345 [Draconibacterium orientale]
MRGWRLDTRYWILDTGLYTLATDATLNFFFFPLHFCHEA